jgi:hypothetical protein
MSDELRDGLAMAIYFVTMLFAIFGLCVFVRFVQRTRRARLAKLKPYALDHKPWRVEEDSEL